MYGPPSLPATGGALIGLVLGVSLGSWAIVVMSLLLVGSIAFSFLNLRRGEKKSVSPM
jgi:uncharacterized membrane protein YoaK (UPF0700 family)